MTYDRFRASAGEPQPPAGVSGPLLALWHDARGEWDAAHRVVQDLGTAEAAWVHAYLHRREGDAGNAGYWYRRASRPHARVPLDEEWTAIARALLDE